MVSFSVSPFSKKLAKGSISLIYFFIMWCSLISSLGSLMSIILSKWSIIWCSVKSWSWNPWAAPLIKRQTVMKHNQIGLKTNLANFWGGLGWSKTLDLTSGFFKPWSTSDMLPFVLKIIKTQFKENFSPTLEINTSDIKIF